ncbi:hypothetical protein FSP39_001484 [Pinctada imbricata]|uniref:Uncharacterized protein n=1 Tax=Pinctada imbricata TaxID=66713 RepID=A0AA89BZM7_PINIB|nr:hypothetical protein FSP39_001484 [Pinctada imbricata]
MSGPRDNTLYETNLSSTVNFAVPSMNIITEYNFGTIEIPTEISPGVLSLILSTLGDGEEREVMLCADRKKVTSGIDSKGGDVDMLNFEDHETVGHRKAELQSQTSILNEIHNLVQGYDENEQLLAFEDNQKDDMGNGLQKYVKVIVSRLKDIRNLFTRQRMGMENIKSMTGYLQNTHDFCDEKTRCGISKKCIMP